MPDTILGVEDVAAKRTDKIDPQSQKVYIMVIEAENKQIKKNQIVISTVKQIEQGDEGKCGWAGCAYIHGQSEKSFLGK